jgi:hypothetical protein
MLGDVSVIVLSGMGCTVSVVLALQYVVSANWSACDADRVATSRYCYYKGCCKPPVAMAAVVVMDGQAWTSTLLPALQYSVPHSVALRADTRVTPTACCSATFVTIDMRHNSNKGT